MIPNHPIFRKLAAFEPYLIPAIVLVVGVGAFGLGRLSASGHQPMALRVLYPDAKPAEPLQSTAAVASAKAAPEAPAGQGSYVASKNGTKYYLATCSGASRIKQENKVYFVSTAQAQAAGYGPAANCPGL